MESGADFVCMPPSPSVLASITFLSISPDPWYLMRVWEAPYSTWKLALRVLMMNHLLQFNPHILSIFKTICSISSYIHVNYARTVILWMHFDEKLLERKYVWSIPQVHFNKKFISGNVLEENLSIMIIKNKSWQGIGFLSFLGMLEMYVLKLLIYFIYSLWSSIKESIFWERLVSI